MKHVLFLMSLARREARHGGSRRASTCRLWRAKRLLEPSRDCQNLMWLGHWTLFLLAAVMTAGGAHSYPLEPCLHEERHRHRLLLYGCFHAHVFFGCADSTEFLLYRGVSSSGTAHRPRCSAVKGPPLSHLVTKADFISRHEGRLSLSDDLAGVSFARSNVESER